MDQRVLEPLLRLLEHVMGNPVRVVTAGEPEQRDAPRLASLDQLALNAARQANQQQGDAYAPIISGNSSPTPAATLLRLPPPFPNSTGASVKVSVATGRARSGLRTSSRA